MGRKIWQIRLWFRAFWPWCVVFPRTRRNAAYRICHCHQFQFGRETRNDGGDLLDLAIKYHGRQNIKRISATFGDFNVGGSFRRAPTDMSANWQFFQRWRGRIGDVEAIKRSPSIRALMKNGLARSRLREGEERVITLSISFSKEQSAIWIHNER